MLYSLHNLYTVKNVKLTIRVHYYLAGFFFGCQSFNLSVVDLLFSKSSEQPILKACCLYTVVLLKMSKVSVYANPQLRLDGPRPTTSPPQLKEIEEERENLRDHPITSPTTGQTRQTSGSESKKRAGSDASANGGGAGKLGPTTPTELYALNGFLGELLSQERVLWERNEFLRHSLG